MRSNYKEITTQEDLDAFIQEQNNDDEKLKAMFADQTHQEFQYSLINTGIMLDIVRGFFHFERQKLEDSVIKVELDKVKTRRINALLKEINQKINLRFELDEDTKIITTLCIYENEGYLMINKALFADLLIQKAKKAGIF